MGDGGWDGVSGLGIGGMVRVVWGADEAGVVGGKADVRACVDMHGYG